MKLSPGPVSEEEASERTDLLPKVRGRKRYTTSAGYDPRVRDRPTRGPTSWRVPNPWDFPSRIESLDDVFKARASNGITGALRALKTQQGQDRP
jgi:hypothetical protein